MEAGKTLKRKGSRVIKCNEEQNRGKQCPATVVDFKVPTSANVAPAGSGGLNPGRDREGGLGPQLKPLYFRSLPSRQIAMLFVPHASPLPLSKYS